MPFIQSGNGPNCCNPCDWTKRAKDDLKTHIRVWHWQLSSSLTLVDTKCKRIKSHTSLTLAIPLVDTKCKRCNPWRDWLGIIRSAPSSCAEHKLFHALAHRRRAQLKLFVNSQTQCMADNWNLSGLGVGYCDIYSNPTSHIFHVHLCWNEVVPYLMHDGLTGPVCERGLISRSAPSPQQGSKLQWR